MRCKIVKRPIRVLYFIFFIVTLFIFYDYRFICQYDSNSKVIKPKNLTEGWLYRIEAINNADNKLSKEMEHKTTDWNLLKGKFSIPIEKKDEVIFLKNQLPKGQWENPCLIFTTIGYNFEVYIDGNLIYSFGEITPNSKRIIGDYRHIIPINNYKNSSTLVIKVHSNFSSLKSIARFTGFLDTFTIPEIDSLTSYQEKMLSRSDNSEKFLGFSFVFMGLTALFILTFVNLKEKSFIHFSIFSICSGIYLIAYNQWEFSFQMSPKWMYYTLLVFLYLIPTGLCGFIEKTFINNRNSTLRKSRYIFYIHLIIMLLLDITNIVPMSMTMNLFELLFLVTVCIIIIILIKEASKGIFEAKIVASAIIIAIVIGLYDLVTWLTVSGYMEQRSSFHFQWGILIIILSLEYVLIRRFIKAHEKVSVLNDELEETQSEIIFTLGEIAEARSHETGDHIKRVAEVSYLLALKYGLSEEDSALLKIASPMHDIGKISIPDHILNKAGKLTDDEFEIIKTHCTAGYKILNKSNRKLMKTAAIISLQHHEKYNGKGYPQGLNGDNIHIFSRITAAADVFDALISERIYKPALTLEEVIEIFIKEKGQHFEPKLVDLLLENIDEIMEAYRNQ